MQQIEKIKYNLNKITIAEDYKHIIKLNFARPR